MTDPQAVAKSQMSPLSLTAVNVVADAYQLQLEPEDEYQESSVALEKLEFASYAVGGLSAAATAPTPGSARSTSSVTVPLSDSEGGTASASQNLTLYGPGDVRGLEHKQIVRRYPRPGAQTAEETVLAHIEFDRPELPWAFSAEAPSQHMRPWLTLVVVERDTVLWEPAATALLPIMRVPLSQLPELNRVHLWAHAQAPRTDKPQEAALSARLSPAHAPVNLSRLLSPRILKNDTNYLAAVVPTTDIGVRGGLGLTGGTLDPAWTSSSPDEIRLPVYDSWQFRTGPDGDFRSLALKLQGVVAPYKIGRRFIDTSAPGTPLAALAVGDQGRKQVLRCALFSPTPPPDDTNTETAVWPTETTTNLRRELDRPASLEGVAAPTEGTPDLPILGPRIYAKLQRGSAVVTGDDWFAELNLAPTNRIVAGLGTRVIQKDQEQLMQAAWAQVGEVEAANRTIRFAQIAELLAKRLHTRLGGLQLGRLLQVTAPLSGRVLRPSGGTLQGAVAGSATPRTVTTGSFRIVTRPGGPIARRAHPATRQDLGGIVGTEKALRDFTRVYRNPDGIGGLSDETLKVLNMEYVAEALGVPIQNAVASLKSMSAIVDGNTLAGYLTRPDQWQPADETFDVIDNLYARWSDRLAREHADPAVESVRAERIGPMVAELARSRRVVDAKSRSRLETRAIALNDLLVRKADLSKAVELPATPHGHTVLSPHDITRVRPHGAAGRRDRKTAKYLRKLDGATTTAKSEGLRRFADLAEVRVAPMLDKVGELSLAAWRAELTTIIDPGALLSIQTVPHRDMLDLQEAELGSLIDPAVNVRAGLNGRLHLPAHLAAKWFAKPFIEEILATPRFDRPMYQALEAYDRDWLMPGLGLLPDDDFVTVLSTNSEFTEAFLVGLSDEMGRELLWRGYPTDRRGTYFYRFWRPNIDDLSQPIHAFSRTSLKSHISLGSGDERAVIVVKSELVRRYPDLIIQVAKNQGTIENPVFESPTSPQITVPELFAEHLEPDIALIGLDISVQELDDDVWWILIAEHPSATRFQRPGDAALPTGLQHLDDNAVHAAQYASDHLHNPVRVAFQATDLIVTGD